MKKNGHDRRYFLRKLRQKESFMKSILSVITLSIIIIGTVIFFVYQKKWMGLVFIALGILHLLVLKIFNRGVKTIWPDIAYGIIDNGLLVVASLIGADFAGIIGVIAGVAAANAITDGFAGLFEGWTAEYIRKHKIKEKRTALSSALGKMAGCFFGAGIVLVIAWTILSL